MEEGTDSLPIATRLAIDTLAQSLAVMPAHLCHL